MQIPERKPKKRGGKGSVAWQVDSKQLRCVFQDRVSEIKSILRKGTKSLGPKRSVQFSKSKSRSVKSGKKGSIPRCNSAFLILTSVAFMFRNLGTDLKRKPWNKSDAPGALRGKWQKVFSSSKTDKATFYSPAEVWCSIIRIRPRSSRLPKFGRCPHHPCRNQRKENSWWILELQCTCWSEKMWTQRNWTLFEYPETLQR